MTPAILIRIRFPLDLLERLDVLAKQVGAAIKHKVPRAALVRALVRLGAAAPSPALPGVIMADTVRRGRAKGPKGGAS